MQIESEGIREGALFDGIRREEKRSMGNLAIKEPPEFTSEIYQVEEEEYITAEIENGIKGALLNNDVYLKKKVEETEKHVKDGKVHVTEEEKRKWDAKAEEDQCNADTVDGYHASAFAKTGHTHTYAGSSTTGGAASSANKLNANAGSAMQPVYFSNGVPVATSVKGVAIQSSTPSSSSVLWAW